MFSFIKSLFSKNPPQQDRRTLNRKGHKSAWAVKELERVTGPGEYMIRTPANIPMDRAQAHVCAILTKRFGSNNYRTNRIFNANALRVIVR
jgi:hypothetical protein